MKKAVMFSLTEDSAEMRSLLDTLGVDVVREFVQKRACPHRESFLGPGKTDEVHKEIEDLDVDLIVISGSLKPSQHHYLEMKFQMECVDRTGVILRIFADHAHTPEAIAQVTLAKLRYELPFLREWIHKAKSGDRPGFLAGGAYATDVYFEHAKTHARKIERNLEELSRQREVTRRKRRERGYSLVSLAGYTNAGKSALMNVLCESDVLVDERLFSTLATTTRRVKGIKGTVLMTDTVGFIRDLPPDLINAFNSTLEEVYYADLIVLVFDASESEQDIGAKLSTSLRILLPKIENRSLIVVGNKVDLLSRSQIEEVRTRVLPAVKPYELFIVSARAGDGLEQLRGRIAHVRAYSCTIEAIVPLTSESLSLLSRVRSISEVDQQVSGSSTNVTIRCKQEDLEKIVGWLKGVGARQVETTVMPQETPPEQAPVSTGNEGAPL